MTHLFKRFVFLPILLLLAINEGVSAQETPNSMMPPAMSVPSETPIPAPPLNNPTNPSPASPATITTTTNAVTTPPMVLMPAPTMNTVQTLQPVSSPSTAQPLVIPVATTMAAPTPAPNQMSMSQFQKWLEINRIRNQAAKARPPVRVITPPVKPITYEESQAAMLATLPAPTTPTNPESRLAFNALLQQNMPLSPQQVVELHQQIDVAQRAAATPPVIPPKPVSSTLMINLAPGTTPPAVRLAQGYVTSLVFVDSASEPWPIAAFDIGNPKAVNMQWDGKSNILLIQAISPYTSGDIVIRLVGNNTPITLELVAGQRVVDYRVDIHVPGIGPNTKDIPVGTGLPNNANQLLLGVLDGIAPDGSRPLTIQGADAQAWLVGNRMYLRTRLTLLSPGWIGTMVSPDGMHAYELPKTSSVLVSRYGEPVELRIEGL